MLSGTFFILCGLQKISKEIEKQFPGIPNSRWIAFRLLEGDKRIVEALESGELI